MEIKQTSELETIRKKLLRAGISYQMIADQLNISKATVGNVLAGRDKSERVLHHCQYLASIGKLKIRLSLAGIKQEEIAQKLNLSRSSVNNVLNGRHNNYKVVNYCNTLLAQRKT